VLNEIAYQKQELIDVIKYVKLLRYNKYQLGDTDVTAERYATYLLLNNIILNAEEFAKSVDNGNVLSALFLNRQLNEILDDLRVIVHESKIDSSSVDRAKLKVNLEKYASFILTAEKAQYTKEFEQLKNVSSKESLKATKALMNFYQNLIIELGLSENAEYLTNNSRINSFKRFIDPSSSISKSMSKFNGESGTWLFKKESMIIHGKYDSLQPINGEYIGGNKLTGFDKIVIINQSRLLEEAHISLHNICEKLWPDRIKEVKEGVNFDL
jgi:hypothetical protein